MNYDAHLGGLEGHRAANQTGEEHPTDFLRMEALDKRPLVYVGVGQQGWWQPADGWPAGTGSSWSTRLGERQDIV